MVPSGDCCGAIYTLRLAPAPHLLPSPTGLVLPCQRTAMGEPRLQQPTRAPCPQIAAQTLMQQLADWRRDHPPLADVMRPSATASSTPHAGRLHCSLGPLQNGPLQHVSLCTDIVCSTAWSTSRMREQASGLPWGSRACSDDDGHAACCEGDLKRDAPTSRQQPTRSNLQICSADHGQGMHG